MLTFLCCFQINLLKKSPVGRKLCFFFFFLLTKVRHLHHPRKKKLVYLNHRLCARVYVWVYSSMCACMETQESALDAILHYSPLLFFSPGFQ